MQTNASIAPVVLAAGDSTRMGHPKALLPLGRGIFITCILSAIRDAGLPNPMLVLGRAASIIAPAIRQWSVDICINPDPSRGQLSSIQLALGRLNPSFTAVMIWPVDQPAVSAGLALNLAGLFLSSGALIALPSYGERRGHPAIIHRKLFQEFMDAPLEEGPKSIFIRHRHETAVLPVNEQAVIQDIDTPADYCQLTGESLDCALARAANS